MIDTEIIITCPKCKNKFKYKDSEWVKLNLISKKKCRYHDMCPAMLEHKWECGLNSNEQKICYWYLEIVRAMKIHKLIRKKSK